MPSSPQELPAAAGVAGSGVVSARSSRARPRHGLRATIGAYVRLTKPRVIELLLVTTVPAMILAAGEFPSLTLVGSVLLGGALAAGGANTIN